MLRSRVHYGILAAAGTLLALGVAARVAGEQEAFQALAVGTIIVALIGLPLAMRETVRIAIFGEEEGGGRGRRRGRA